MTSPRVFQEWSRGVHADRQVKRSDRNLPTFLVHNFSHEYTLASLTLDSLKGTDRVQAEALKLAAAATGSILLLATAELEIQKDEEDYGEGFETDRHTTLQSLRSLDGAHVGDFKTEYEDDHTLRPLVFDEEDPDDEEHEGYTGNEGAPATFWYRKAVCILVPEAAADMFMFQGSNCWKWATSKLRDLLSSISEQPAHLDRIARLSQHILGQSKSPSSIFDLPYSVGFYSAKANTEPNAAQLACHTQIALAALEIDNMALFDDAVKWNVRVLTAECFERMGALMAQAGQNQLLTRIITGLSRLPLLLSRFQFVQCALTGFDTAAVGDLEAKRPANRELLEHECCHAVLDAPGGLSKEDDVTIARMLVNLPAQAEITRTQLVDKLLGKSITALIGFVLHWHAQSCTYEGTDHHQILLRVLNLIWSRFDSEGLCGKLISDINCVASESARVVTSEDLKQLLIITRELRNGSGDASMATLVFGYDEQQISAKLIKACASADAYDLFALWLDFTALVTAKQLYATLYIGKKPVKPTDWVKARIGTCTCADCGLVDAFLASPTEQIARFPFVQRRRDHLDHVFKDPLTSYSYKSGRSVKQTFDYNIQTIQTGRPYTWQITKCHRAYDERLKK
ncbi:hypothetical protein Micbo1qcDRAFT_206561 [Microdochium bolleyi]|uniref:Uncharacterized protein n=1 Tax=Microdochium bolleyi TaxID=196109 RepID=A0A136IVP4_9PEZI|nr:hypothetical protein Micbo1qcDRAFT_206561 [Microdochium bolleyi]